MEKFEMICINCPLGCNLTVEKDENVIKVSGNTCPRGEKYAIAELTHPTRTLTTTMAVSNREGKYVSVKTNAPISKSKLFDAMKLVNSTKAEAPVHAGDIL
ncbi:MAG: DUF1667 domain-containing protein, partial [Eubacteriales bacterium]